jgi:trehalose/maltose hydrolase-like predicted phosphorylase
MCAETGHLDLARDYLNEAALVDLHDLQRTTEHGVHLASLAGAWIGVVAGFGGLREDGEVLRLAPALPATVEALTFRVRWRGMRLEVRVAEGRVRCAVAGPAGCRMPLRLYDEDVEVGDDAPVVRPLRRPAPLLPPPTQPPGRAPRRINGDGDFDVPDSVEADHLA